MPYPSVSGMPDYSSTGPSKFSQSVWSGRLQIKFYEATVFKQIANTLHDGEIKEQGDLIYIKTIPDITIRDYVKGQTLDYERPNSIAIDLVIDKGKYFAFTCDDVDKWQADDELFNIWGNDASEQLKVVIDADILGTIPDDAHMDNKGAAAGAISGTFNLGATGAPVQLTKTNVLDYLVDCGTVLDEQNIPENDRWVVIPAWLAGMIKKSDLRDASMTNDNVSMARNGRLGVIDRFTVFASNSLSSVSDSGESVYKVLFGHRSALTFASQITKVETLRAESTFGDLVRGLIVYGYKVIKPDSLGLLYCYR